MNHSETFFPSIYLKSKSGNHSSQPPFRRVRGAIASEDLQLYSNRL